jgi:hypothetical protein
MMLWNDLGCDSLRDLAMKERKSIVRICFLKRWMDRVSDTCLFDQIHHIAFLTGIISNERPKAILIMWKAPLHNNFSA